MTSTPAAGYENYKLSSRELESMAHAVAVAWGETPAQSDAWRFGFTAGAVLNMASLLERIDPAAFDMAPELADAVSLAACESTDAIAAWLVAHGKAPAGDVNQVREHGWSHGIGALCGHAYRLSYMLRVRTGQLD